jgi:Fe-Mn family superoxide dismutase
MTIRPEQQAVQVWDDEGGQPSSNSGNNPETDPAGYFVAESFQIPELTGISAKNIQEHLELYQGYVKAANRIIRRVRELTKDDDHMYELSLLQRQFAYEHAGMTHHEKFFEQFVGGPNACADGGPFLTQVAKEFGNLDSLTSCLKGMATTRGVGWVMLYSSPDNGHLIPHWINEHHIGLLTGLRPILALDMWEHAFVYDYATSEKKKYIDAFFQNLNWQKVELRFGSSAA